MSSRTLLLVAGPSGCGKSRFSRVATQAGGVTTLPLDEFYRDLDHPGLPRTLGIVDWDDVHPGIVIWPSPPSPGSFATAPQRYPRTTSHSRCASVLTRWTWATPRCFSPKGSLRPRYWPRQGPLIFRVEALWLARHRSTNFTRRLLRDLKEKRKAPMVLLRRGGALYRSEPQLAKDAVAAGFRPAGMREATRVVAILAGQKDSVRSPRTASIPE